MKVNFGIEVPNGLNIAIPYGTAFPGNISRTCLVLFSKSRIVTLICSPPSFQDTSLLRPNFLFPLSPSFK